MTFNIFKDKITCIQVSTFKWRATYVYNGESYSHTDRSEEKAIDMLWEYLVDEIGL